MIDSIKAWPNKKVLDYTPNTPTSSRNKSEKITGERNKNKVK